ncbi:MarR family winged helix-turn-helix transcriptional regulator [Laceyella putida]|uniref:MarR family winged helix-turn-helix transcriptional regulator n=1 Tax=Laceyella putida TaxID=110101 RepID=A0ABW2RHT8_9BACL
MGSDLNWYDPQLQRFDQISERFAQYMSKQFDELPYKLTPVKFVLLRTVYVKGKCMVVDLSRQVNLTSGATTLALNKLEQEGMIVRTRDHVDRRIVWVELTDEGKSIVEQTVKRRQQVIRKMLDVLTVEEQEMFIQLMEKISVKISQM